MSVPANFKSAITSKDVVIRRWLEIEGIPYAYGTFSQTSGFFAARAAGIRFLGVRAQLLDVPRNLDQAVDTLEGGNLTVGQTDFEISDDDGEPTKWTGVGYQTNVVTLNGAITATATTINVHGSTAGYANGDYLYIGHETILIGTVTGTSFTGCTRGMFRSIARAWGSGYPASTRPYSMANRRCWYMEVATTPTGTALSATDPDKATRFAGTLRSFRMKDDQHNAYVLTADSIDRELDRPCFRKLRSFRLASGPIMDADGKNGVITAPGNKGWTGGASTTWNQTDSLLNFPLTLFPTMGEQILLRIDSEIFWVERLDAVGLVPGVLKIRERGLFGTKVEAHKDGALCQEVVAIYRGQNTYSGLAEIECSQFNSTPTAASPIQSDHPLLIILQVLLSTGTGTNNDGVGRNYDKLPADWGMGVDISRVDVNGILAAAMEEPTLKFGGIVDAPINFIAFMRDLLRMAGYYFIIQVGDLFTIRRLRPPLPDVPTTSITNANRIRKFFTKWEANWSGSIRELVFKFGWDIVESKFKRTVVFRLGDGDVYNQVTRLDAGDAGRTGVGSARSLEVVSKFLYPGKSGIPGELHAEAFDVDEWLKTRADFFMTRYGRPPPIIRERLDYGFLDLEIGDLVDITHANLPDAATGARGLTETIGEIVGKSIDDNTKTINFTILLTGWKLGSYRFIAPALCITADEGGGVFLHETNRFTEAIGPFSPALTVQTDNEIQQSDGTIAYPFPVDTECWLFSSDFAHKVPCTVTGHIDETHIELTGTGFGDISDIDGVNYLNGFLVYRDYQTVKDSLLHQEQEYAFMADADDELGSDQDDAHKIFPL